MITTSTAFMRWFLHRDSTRLFVGLFTIILEAVRSWRVSLLILIMPLVLSGCSMVQTVYNKSPELAYWWIDGFVDVSADQRPLLMEDLQAYQQWHRATQLPRYALFESADAGTSRLVSSLSADQVEHLRNKLDRHHRDWRRDWVEPGPAEVLDKRVQRTRERAEDFYGRLDVSQQRLLRQQAERSPYDVTLGEAVRLRRQEDIVTTLRGLVQQRPAPEEWRRQVRALLQRSVISPVPAHQTYVERLHDYNCRSIAQLHNSTSAEQRQAAIKRLQKYERDARALMAR